MAAIKRQTRAGFLLLTASLFFIAPAGAQAIHFSDKFDPPSSPWHSVAGDWTGGDGKYYATVPNNNPFAITILPFDVAEYTLDVTVNNLGDSGILVRTNGTGSKYVLLVLGGYGYGQGTRGGNAGNSIYWADSSNPAQITNPVNGVFTPGKTYDITVKASGNTFSAYINGSSTAVTSVTDAVAGSAGLVGLYDDQPNDTTGSGFGPATSYSDFVLTGTMASSDATVTPVIVGTRSPAGWYVSKPTDLSWIVTGKPTPTESGCGAIAVPDTKSTKYTCSASNELGSAQDSVTIKKDTVDPTVQIVRPASGATYQLKQKISASYTCADSTSADATCKGTVPDGVDIPTSVAGTQTFVVTAKDNAGNVTTKSVSYTVK
jgi:hypothetical protein